MLKLDKFGNFYFTKEDIAAISIIKINGGKEKNPEYLEIVPRSSPEPFTWLTYNFCSWKDYIPKFCRILYVVPARRSAFGESVVYIVSNRSDLKELLESTVVTPNTVYTYLHDMWHNCWKLRGMENLLGEDNTGSVCELYTAPHPPVPSKKRTCAGNK